MSRAATLLFAIISYAIFFATFLYLIVFVGDFPISGRTVDVGAESPVAVAAVIDIALIALFGLQHSVMTRPGCFAQHSCRLSQFSKGHPKAGTSDLGSASDQKRTSAGWMSSFTYRFPRLRRCKIAL